MALSRQTYGAQAKQTSVRKSHNGIVFSDSFLAKGQGHNLVNCVFVINKVTNQHYQKVTQ